MSALYKKYQRLRRQKRRNIILNTVCLMIAASGLLWTINYFWRYINYEITNDAFVDQYIAPVNVRVSGYISEIRFKEHQYVKEGDTLVILDNNEYLIRQKEARAALLDARGSKDVLTSGIQTSHTRIAEQEANIAEAKAKLWQSEQDFRRYERLLKEESVPRQQYDVAKANYEAAQARYTALLRQEEAARSQYDEASKKQVSAEASRNSMAYSTVLPPRYRMSNIRCSFLTLLGRSAQTILSTSSILCINCTTMDRKMEVLFCIFCKFFTVRQGAFPSGPDMLY